MELEELFKDADAAQRTATLDFLNMRIWYGEDSNVSDGLREAALEASASGITRAEYAALRYAHEMQLAEEAYQAATGES